MTDRANHLKEDAITSLQEEVPAASGTKYIDGSAAGDGTGSGIDLGILTTRGARLADCEVCIKAPAIALAVLPDTETITYTLESDEDSGFGTPRTEYTFTQTGATGTDPCAAVEYRHGIASDCERYLRVKMVGSAGIVGTPTDVATMALVY